MNILYTHLAGEQRTLTLAKEDIEAFADANGNALGTLRRERFFHLRHHASPEQPTQSGVPQWGRVKPLSLQGKSQMQFQSESIPPAQ